MSAIKLTKSQNRVVSKVKEFVTSDNEIFILTGSAGTGKTTVVKNIINEVSNLVTNVILLAPTNRAVKVLSKKTGHIASTIHSELYIVKEIKDSDGNLIETRLIPRYHNLLLDQHEQKSLSTQNNLYIIDESSMISSSPNKDGTLVSENSLLEDLYRHVTKYSKNNKILFVGDSYQLPPIGDTGIAPALRRDFLVENFTTKILEESLTEVLRQGKDSPILTIADDLKLKIDANITTYNLNLPNKLRGYNDFINNYSDTYDSNNFEHSIALGWSRKNVLKMNLDLRNKLFNGKPEEFEVGDNLYLNSKWSSKNITIPKGEIGKVLKIVKSDGVKGEMLFHTLCIEFKDTLNNPYAIEAKVLTDYAYSETEFIPKSAFINLAIQRSNENPLYKKTHEPLDDEFMSAMQVKFAYALTVHKSQGGEWENVFLDANTNWKDLRWNYTAVTRASENIYSYYK